jgi:preprotein translocase subunit Sss1
MVFRSPKYYEELRKYRREQERKLQASKRPSNEELESLKKYVKEKKKPI